MTAEGLSFNSEIEPGDTLIIVNLSGQRDGATISLSTRTISLNSQNAKSLLEKCANIVALNHDIPEEIADDVEITWTHPEELDGSAVIQMIRCILNTIKSSDNTLTLNEVMKKATSDFVEQMKRDFEKANAPNMTELKALTENIAKTTNQVFRGENGI